MEKEFDFIKTLEDTSKALELDAVRIVAKKEMLNEIIEYVKQNNLKFIKVEKDEETEVKETKKSK